MTEAVKYNQNLIHNIMTCIKSKSAKVLDFGAGSGTYADLLVEQGIKPDCLEPDKNLQKILKSKGYNVLSDIGKVNPGSYDVVYALNVLEHIKNDHEIIENLAKLLKKNGRLLIYVPAFDVLFSSMDKKVEHYRRYRKQSLVRNVEASGLQIVAAQYCDPIGFFAALAYKIAGNKKGTLSHKMIRSYDRLIFPASKSMEVVFKNTFGKNVLVVAKKR